jgi:hypothetical protein
MNVKSALTGQYHAALAMLKECIERCPENLWTADSHPVPFWRVAYHTLYGTHLYLQPDEAHFQPWELHRDGCQELPGPDETLSDVTPYTKSEILRYWRFCNDMVSSAMEELDLDAPLSGFSWHKMPKLDHQLQNIRHIQHHAALLSGRLRQACGMDIIWVRRNNETYLSAQSSP